MADPTVVRRANSVAAVEVKTWLHLESQGRESVQISEL